MAKYKNISNLKVMLKYGADLISISPGEIKELTFVPEQTSNILVEVMDQPKKKYVDEIKQDQSSDLPEDYVVVVSDSIVEELEKEKSAPRKSRSRKN